MNADTGTAPSARGLERRLKPTFCGRRSALRWFNSLADQTRFSQASLPPNERGTTWSRLPSSPEFEQPRLKRGKGERTFRWPACQDILRSHRPAVTRITEGHVPDAVYERARSQFCTYPHRGLSTRWKWQTRFSVVAPEAFINSTWAA